MKVVRPWQLTWRHNPRAWTDETVVGQVQGFGGGRAVMARHSATGVGVGDSTGKKK